MPPGFRACPGTVVSPEDVRSTPQSTVIWISEPSETDAVAAADGPVLPLQRRWSEHSRRGARVKKEAKSEAGRRRKSSEVMCRIRGRARVGL